MKKNYKVIAFDLDGTLTNPERGLVSGFVYALKKMGTDYADKSTLRKYIGPPLIESWEEDYGYTREQANLAVTIFREYFGVYGWWDNELYEGIKELLAKLKAAGKTIVLSTSKPDIYSSKILKLFEIDGYFDFSEGATADHSREAKCDVLRYALDAVGVGSTEEELSECVLVGDTRFDVEGANIVGIDSIGVLYGFGTEDQLRTEGATYIARTVADIADILL